MKCKFLLIISFLLFTVGRLFSQEANSGSTPQPLNSLELQLVKPDSNGKKDIKKNLIQFVGVLEEGEQIDIYIINKGNRRMYYNLLEIQPQNEISFLYPGTSLRPLDCYVLPNDTLSIGTFIIMPPYGVNKLILLENETPFNVEPAVTRTRGPGQFGNITVEQLKIELVSLVMGRPSSILRNIGFSFFDYYLIPKPVKTSAAIFRKPQYSSTGGAQSFTNPFPLFVTDDCISQIEDLKNLYVKHPIVSIVQPLKAGGSGLNRGSEPVFETEVATYTVKGTAMAQKGIKTVLINGK